MKNLSILISKSFFIGLASLWEARQSISYNISFCLTIFDLEEVSREMLSPADLMRAQTLRIYESTEVIMVNKDEDLVFTTF